MSGVSGVFRTIDYWALDGLVDWIVVGDNEHLTLADLLFELLPTPPMNEPAVRVAWDGDAMMRTAAYLRAIQLEAWHEDEADYQGDEFGALRKFARNHATMIRLCLIEPAEPDQIADALAILADVLGQDVGEKTAAFIIELVLKAELPLFVVNALFQEVGKVEAGRIKPVCFTRLLPRAEARLRQVRQAGNVRDFVNHLEPALTYFEENLMSGDKPAPARSSARSLTEA